MTSNRATAHPRAAPGGGPDAPAPAPAPGEAVTTPRTPSAAATALVVGGAAACIPGVPPSAALAAGVAVALTVGNPFAARTRVLAKRLLPAAVVGLGGAMNLGAVARAGVHGVGYTVATLSATAVLGALLARALRVERRTAALVTVGTAICGGSAIAAAAPVLGADDRETSVALGTVFVLNSVALVIFPPLGRAAGLDAPAFGLWAALGIHDTSSVVGAALAFGGPALAVATTVKLARALWIVPVTLALGAAERRRAGGARAAAARPPWFVLGFLGVAALATWAPALRPVGLAVAFVAQRALVLTLFLVGLGLSRASLREVGPRPFLLGIALWVGMAAATLAAVRSGLFAVP